MRIENNSSEETVTKNTSLNKRKIVFIVTIICILLVVLFMNNYYAKRVAERDLQAALVELDAVKKEYLDVVGLYNDSVQESIDSNNSLVEAVDVAKMISEMDDPLYDERLSNNLNALITEAESKIRVDDDLIDPASIGLLDLHESDIDDKWSRDQLVNETKRFRETIDRLRLEISSIEIKIKSLPEAQDHGELEDKLLSCAGAYVDSIEIMAQITQPDEDWIKQRLNNVSEVTGSQSVTPEHDPNKHLGEEGWYTACVYFSVKEIDQQTISGTNLVDKGTLAGGAIEVYRTAEDAQAREEYLSSFDGTLIRPGSRYILGTMVIRASAELEASAQERLTDSIVGEFTRLE